MTDAKPGTPAMEMSEPGLEKYKKLMERVKLRTDLIDRLGTGADNLPAVPQVEFAALQFRKILELIAFGSLVANEKAYSGAYAQFANEWNAKKLLQKIESLNPDFYPVPVKQVNSNIPGTVFAHQKIKDGYLTRNDFATVYQRCSELIHTANPYNTSQIVDLRRSAQDFAVWRNKIVTPLNLHELHLLSDPGIAVCFMNANGTGQVAVQRLSYVGKAKEK